VEKLQKSGLIEEDSEIEEDDEQGDEEAGPVTVVNGVEVRPKKPRGKNKVLKRILRRKKNIIDARTEQIKELVDERRRATIDKKRQAQAQRAAENGDALARFGI